jgi:hypothetical protein
LPTKLRRWQLPRLAEKMTQSNSARKRVWPIAALNLTRRLAEKTLA